MSFADVQKADAAVLVNPAELGEEIAYLPGGTSPRTINARVTRHPLIPNGSDDRQTLQNVLEISILNHETLGVSSVDKAKDKVQLRILLGGEIQTLRVVEILSQSHAQWRLKVRK